MSQLTVYGICLALTIALLGFGAQRKGVGFLMPFILIPPVLAAFLTRDPANLFAPNGSSTRPITKVLTVIFALLLVPLLSGGVYGTYRTAAWLIATEGTVRTSALAGALLPVNTGLWLLSAVLVVLLLVHLRQSWQWILRMNHTGILLGYATPLVMHGLGFVVLAATRTHLLPGPVAGALPGFGVGVAAIGCANLLVFTLVRNLLGYKTLIGQIQVPAELTLKLFRTLSLLHAVLFGYYLIRLFFLA